MNWVQKCKSKNCSTERVMEVFVWHMPNLDHPYNDPLTEALGAEFEANIYGVHVAATDVPSFGTNPTADCTWSQMLPTMDFNRKPEPVPGNDPDAAVSSYKRYCCRKPK